ncbi:MAG: hypothetical protein PHX34_03765 [Candidatus Shapirobacteria bacterium]|nr:hypothetical protein [Candidatus Shapirobacteria bacterium]
MESKPLHNLIYADGKITKESTLIGFSKRDIEKKRESSMRPMAERLERANYYHKIIDIRKTKNEEVKKILDSRTGNGIGGSEQKIGWWQKTKNKINDFFNRKSHKTIEPNNENKKTIFNRLSDWWNKFAGKFRKNELTIEERQKLYNEKRNKIKSVLFEAKQLDKITKQFLNERKQISVNMGNLGIQGSNFVFLDGAERYKESEEETEKRKKLPPVVYIPGISGGLDSTGEFAIKLAMSGRNVLAFTYPESWFGFCTREFGDAVAKSDNFDPHKTYFKKIILEKIRELNIEKFDIYGVSTGSLIISELMKDEDIKSKIDQAVMIVPPGISKAKNLNVGIIKELIKNSFNKIKLLPKLSVYNKTSIVRNVDHRQNMLHTYMALQKNVVKEYNWQDQNLISSTNKKSIFIICKNDYVTNPMKNIGKIDGNQTIKYKVIKGGHATPTIEANRVINTIKEMI